MKSIYIILIFLSATAYTQTYITPLIGGEYLSFISETKKSVLFSEMVMADDLSNLSLDFGVTIEQLLSKRSTLNYSFSFAKHTIAYYEELATAPKLYFTFTYYKSSLGVNYYLNKNVFCGLGVHVNALSNIKGLAGIGESSFKKNRQEVGAFGSINLDLDNIILSFKMSHYIFYINEAEFNYDFKGIRGFELLFGYRFKVIKKFKGKERVLCPS